MRARSCSAARASEKRLDERRPRARSRRSSCRSSEWSVCLPEHHPGYVVLAGVPRRPASGCARNVRPRGEGGGAAREGAALLQGLVRCGRCGRRMQVAYSGTDGTRPALCVRARRISSHGTEPELPVARRRAAGSGRRRGVPGGRDPGRRRARPPARSRELERPARRSASPASGSPLERAEFEADRARRQFDACEPEHRLVARTLERALEDALGDARARAAASSPRSSTRRPAPLTDRRARGARAARARPAAAVDAPDDHRPRSQGAAAHARSARSIVTVDARRARAPTSRSAGKAARAPSCSVRLNRRGPERTPHRRGHDRADPPPRRPSPRPPDRRDPQPPRPPHRHRAAVHRAARARAPASAPASPPRRRRTRTASWSRSPRPPTELGVSTATIRRWLRDGLLPGEQTTPHAPWRIRLTDEIRARFVPDDPRRLRLARRGRPARSASPARPCCIKVQRGELARHPRHPGPPQRARDSGIRRQPWTDCPID